MDDLEKIASEFENACYDTNPETPGGGRASDFVWHENVELPLSSFGSPEPWQEWWKAEKVICSADEGNGEDGNGNRLHKFEKYWDTNPVDPIIVVFENNRFYVWDGSHRIALSIVKKRTTIHAIVGVKKEMSKIQQAVG